MLRDGQEVSIDVVPFDSTQRTYVVKDGVTYKIDDGTSVIYGGVSGIMKGYRVFLGVDNVQVTLEEGESLTIKDNKYFSGVETVTTVYTTPTSDIDVTYNAIDIQRMNASLGSGFLDIATSDITVSGMTVTIQPQRACIDGITVNAKESTQLPIDNGLSQLRTDLIVLRKTQTTASADYFVKKGELGSTTPPALEQVSLGIYEVPVCSIRVNANQTTLELSNITDLRNYLTRERDKPVEDTGTGINPLQSSTFVLTNTSTTRTISNGLWVGQAATIFNSTPNTITITDGSFTFTVLANDKREVQWNGVKWESVSTFDTLTVQTKATVPSPISTTDATNKEYVDSRTSAYITETGGDNTTWYKKWSDGFIECGGVYKVEPYPDTDIVHENPYTVTMPVSFSSAEYMAIATVNAKSRNTNSSSTQIIATKTQNSFVFSSHQTGAVRLINATGFNWYAAGF